jgi:hypothetical protein
MKYKFFRTILAVMALIITSCSKDKSPYTPDISLNNVSATISIGNNASFQFSATGAAAKIYPLLANPSSYRIEAKDANNNSLIIAVENVTQTGTYPFTGNNGSGNGLSFFKDAGSISQVTYSTSDPSITNKRSFTITALNNHHIEGLFTAFCKNANNVGEAAQVSNGSFKGNF